jgi:hypothetical protein
LLHKDSPLFLITGEPFTNTKNFLWLTTKLYLLIPFEDSATVCNMMVLKSRNRGILIAGGKLPPIGLIFPLPGFSYEIAT